MKQNYHSNATTNLHIRTQIQKSDCKIKTLSIQYSVHENSIRKWKKRTFQNDLSSRPKTIYYSLSEIDEYLIVSVRKSTFMSLDDIVDLFQEIDSKFNRSNIYRIIKKHHLNKIPEEKKNEAKKFKEYEPGFIHMDVTYLPKIDGEKKYLFVAIDRCTRTLFYKIYSEKTGKNTEDFVKHCHDFFPFEISHILTDNGLEFTNRLIKSKKGELCKKPSLLDQYCEKNEIKHRLTKPGTPKTNGMVERVNNTVKTATVKNNLYESYEKLEKDFEKYLIFYNFKRRHSGLVKELKVRTPFEAIQFWYKLKPEIFKKTTEEFQTPFFKSFTQPRET